MTHPRAAGNRTGFTFLELTIATAMMAVLALSLYSALRVAFKARDTALSAVGPARSAELAVEMVRRDLESALPPTGDMAGEFMGQYGTEPDTSAVRFYAVGGPVGSVAASVATADGGRVGTPSAGFGNGGDQTAAVPGIRRIEFVVRPSTDPAAAGLVLVRRTWRPRDLLANVDPPPEEETLCRGVTAFTIQYYDGVQWLDEWDSSVLNNALPAAVDVRLELARPPAADGTPATGYLASRVFFLACRRDAATIQAAVPGGGR